MNITYTAVESRVGVMLLAATDAGVCKISMADAEPELTADLSTSFPAATIARDDAALRDWADVLLRYLNGDLHAPDLPLDIHPTDFQRRVWDALRTIPYGSTRTYQEVATMIGQPKASRAIGSACAANPVALVIPCHRVLPKNGRISGYRWGADRKAWLLSHERGMSMG